MLGHGNKWQPDRKRPEPKAALRAGLPSPGWQGQGCLGRHCSQGDVTPHLLCRAAASAPPSFPEEAGTGNYSPAHMLANLLPHYVP